MFRVVAQHQAGFICLHVEHTATGIEDPSACACCQAAPAIWCKHQRELWQGRPSVNVYNCRCDERGRFLSGALFIWPWTQPNTASDNEGNMPGLRWEPFCFCCPSSLVTEAGKSTAKEIRISLLSRRCMVCFWSHWPGETCSKAGNVCRTSQAVYCRMLNLFNNKCQIILYILST